MTALLLVEQIFSQFRSSAFQENYFGSYQEPIAFGEKRKFRPSTEEADDPREYRPFAVRVNAQIHDVQGHLLKVRRVLLEGSWRSSRMKPSPLSL